MVKINGTYYLKIPLILTIPLRLYLFDLSLNRQALFHWTMTRLVRVVF